MKLKLAAFLVFAFLFGVSQKEVLLPSLDGLLIHSKLYVTDSKEEKIMLLCHQARYSKGEYKETAPKFNKLGYTCLAIDQRSGDSINRDINQTALQAKQQGKPNDYEDAEQDIKGAIYYLYNTYNKKITLVGSSYSSSLIIKIAAEEKDKVEAVVSFSPGDYFKEENIIKNSLKKLDIPVFITCSKEEIPETENWLKGVENKKITFFKPEKDGKHGSKALWNNNPNNKEYWKALTAFLKTK